MKVSLWNVMIGNAYDWIVNTRKGLQRANIIWDGTET